MNNGLKIRELYAPSHFGNSYEVALDREMAGILSEARHWGFNRFSDWFDAIDLNDVYKRDGKAYDMPEAMWDRKFSNFSIASKLGFDLSLAITPNHVFSDQVSPSNAAQKSDRIFGQLVCPSKPGATETVLSNYRNLFDDFKRRGLKLKSLMACPYDYGGCLCEECSPWIVAFGKLYKQIASLAKESFGDMEINLIGWWWSEDDHRDFTEWADKEAPGLFDSMSFHLPYGETAYKPHPTPAGARERAFVHIGYGEKGHPDVYGKFGPCIAPARIEATVKHLMDRKAEGFCAYSEGVYDDINKALLAGLSSGRFSSAREVLEEYATRHLGGDAKAWSDFIQSMGDFDSIEAAGARRSWNILERKAKPGWRLEQLKSRLVMAEANAAVMARTEWDSARETAAETFWATREHLYRDVWRLGMPRHIFKFDTLAPSWHEDYKRRLDSMPAGAAAFGKEA